MTVNEGVSTVIPDVGQALRVPRPEIQAPRPHSPFTDPFQIRPEKMLQANSRTIVGRRKSQRKSLSGK